MEYKSLKDKAKKLLAGDGKPALTVVLNVHMPKHDMKRMGKKTMENEDD